VDPLTALEKTTAAEHNLRNVQIPRLEALESVSSQFNADPYTLSTKVRKRFREEKKVEREKIAADDAIKGRYGLPQSMRLIRDSEDTAQSDKDAWQQARRTLESKERKRMKLPVQTSLAIRTPRHRPTNDTVSNLRDRVLGRRSSKLL